MQQEDRARGKKNRTSPRINRVLFHSSDVDQTQLDALGRVSLTPPRSLLHLRIRFTFIVRTEAILLLQVVEDWPQAIVVAAWRVCRPGIPFGETFLLDRKGLVYKGHEPARSCRLQE